MKIIQSSAVRDAMTAPTTVRASHVLVKHANSRRPASWRDPDGEHISKRTKEAAIDELVTSSRDRKRDVRVRGRRARGVGLFVGEKRWRFRGIRSRGDAARVRGGDVRVRGRGDERRGGDGFGRARHLTNGVDEWIDCVNAVRLNIVIVVCTTTIALAARVAVVVVVRGARSASSPLCR